jgi:hypothetical protein
MTLVTLKKNQNFPVTKFPLRVYTLFFSLKNFILLHLVLTYKSPSTFQKYPIIQAKMSLMNSTLAIVHTISAYQRSLLIFNPFSRIFCFASNSMKRNSIQKLLVTQLVKYYPLFYVLKFPLPRAQDLSSPWASLIQSKTSYAFHLTSISIRSFS